MILHQSDTTIQYKVISIILQKKCPTFDFGGLPRPLLVDVAAAEAAPPLPRPAPRLVGVGVFAGEVLAAALALLALADATAACFNSSFVCLRTVTSLSSSDSELEPPESANN